MGKTTNENLIESAQESLGLQHANLNIGEFSKLLDLLTDNQKLKEINLGFNHFSPDCWRKIFAAFKKTTLLSSLQLAGCRFGVSTPRTSGGKLKSLLNLTELFIFLNSNKFITHLNLRSNALGEDGAGFLESLLKNNRAITHLDLRNNPLGFAGLKKILGGLKENTVLTALDLGENNFVSQEAAEALAEFISETKTLTHLSLRRSGFSESGWVIIAQAIAKNTSLTSLDLSGNLLPLEAIRILSQNKNLLSLELRANSFRLNEGLQAAMNGFKKGSLRMLDLAWNIVDTEAPFLPPTRRCTLNVDPKKPPLPSLRAYHAGLFARPAPAAKKAQKRKSTAPMASGKEKLACGGS